jgi:hypothetical protein
MCVFLVAFSDARVTTSRVMCDGAFAKDAGFAKDELRQMVADSKSLGMLVGVVATNVASDVSDARVRERLGNDSAILFDLIDSLGIRHFERSVEFVEGSPRDYGCKHAPSAVIVEFIYDH